METDLARRRQIEIGMKMQNDGRNDTWFLVGNSVHTEFKCVWSNNLPKRENQG